MKAIVKVERNGIRIPMERLKGISESDIVEIRIKKVYVDDDFKKSVEFPIVL